MNNTERENLAVGESYPEECPITLRVTACKTGGDFLVHFPFQSEAMAYVTRKEDTCAFQELEEKPVPSKFQELIRLLNPECEHGMPLENCYGPQHDPYDDDELAAHYGPHYAYDY